MPASENIERCNSSMQLTRAADYAVRVMIHLAGLPSHQRLALPALVQATGAPDSFLSKILQALTHARLITSRRGPTGGFQISARGLHASMRDVIEAIDGPMRLNVCLSERRACPRKDWCPAHPVWIKAQSALMQILDSAMIADLAGQENVTLPVFAERKTGTSD